MAAWPKLNQEYPVNIFDLIISNNVIKIAKIINKKFFFIFKFLFIIIVIIKGKIKNNDRYSVNKKTKKIDKA